MTINTKINELRCLLRDCKNPNYKRQLEVDLTSYMAIKNLFDSLETKKRK